MENYSDRQAGRCRACPDRLEVDPYATALRRWLRQQRLGEFRKRLVRGEAEEHLLDNILGRLVEASLVKKHGEQRTDSTHVLAAVRELNRLELVTSGDARGLE